MRVHPRSADLDPASLRAGHDLVLEPEPWHGNLLPDGTATDDFLNAGDRREIERLALASTRAWRRALDRHLTIEGLCLPFIWELEIYMLVRELTHRAMGLRAAFEALQPTTVTAAATGVDGALIAAVAGACGAKAEAPRVHAHPEPPLQRGRTGVRRTLAQATRRTGLPSRLRPGSVLFISYWPLEPVLDQMLAGHGPRPAIMADKLPTGLRRVLRSAAAGGWVGAPGPRERRWARSLVSAAFDSLPGPPEIETCGIETGRLIHDAISRLARGRAVDDLARARMLRRAFSRRPPAAILTAWDTVPIARLTISVAREAGIPSFALQHGVYLPPTLLHEPDAIGDLQYADELLVWSDRNRYPTRPGGRSTHVVGYPVPHPPPPPTRRAPAERSAIIVILAQVATKNPPMSARIEMQHWLTAIETIGDAAPGSQIILRPHPSSGTEAAQRAAACHPAETISIDVETPIEALLADTDLCVGAITAATLQCALVGAPVVTLNLSGLEAEWPLGGETTVPLARSRVELRGWIARWRDGEPLPGRDELLSALGATGGDPCGRIRAALAQRTAVPESLVDMTESAGKRS